MTLSEYIRKRGAKACSREWGVALRTVNYWQAGTTKPSRKRYLPRIMKASGLKLTDIYR